MPASTVAPEDPKVKISIDRAKAATMGLSVTDIVTTIRTSVGGSTATFFREGGEEYEILVRYQEQDRLSGDDMVAIPIQTPAGPVVPLESLVRVDRTEGPLAIERKDQQRTITVSGNLSGARDVGAVVGDLEREMRSLDVPPDLAVVFPGSGKSSRKNS